MLIDLKIVFKNFILSLIFLCKTCHNTIYSFKKQCEFTMNRLKLQSVFNLVLQKLNLFNCYKNVFTKLS